MDNEVKISFDDPTQGHEYKEYIFQELKKAYKGSGIWGVRHFQNRRDEIQLIFPDDADLNSELEKLVMTYNGIPETDIKKTKLVLSVAYSGWRNYKPITVSDAPPTMWGDFVSLDDLDDVLKVFEKKGRIWIGDEKIKVRILHPMGDGTYMVYKLNGETLGAVFYDDETGDWSTNDSILQPALQKLQKIIFG